MAYYFMKLVPPRATFPGDASAEEMAAMSRHADYIRDLIEREIVIVAGPVKEGEGSWGLGVAQGATEEELEEIFSNDPVVLAGLGFRWTIFPMGSLLFKEN